MIDWFTVAAQIVNFLILVALLKYFLYGRIVAAMKQRQEEISARWEEADQRREAAAKELEVARDKNRQLDEQREASLVKVRDEVEVYRQQLTSQVRADAEDQRTRWAESIREETDAFLSDLRRRAAEEICEIARRVLSDLAGADLERQIVQRFVQNVEQLDDRGRQSIIASLEEGNRVAVVQTTHPLPRELESSIKYVLCSRLLKDLDVKFEQSDDLLCGIALHTDAHKLAWSLRDYLLLLEQQLRISLDEETSAKGRDAPALAGAGTVK